MPHLEVRLNDRKNLVHTQNHRSWRSSVDRELAARTQQNKACRPVAPEWAEPLAVSSFPEIQRAPSNSKSDRRRSEDAFAAMHRRMLRDVSEPTHWAGLPLQQNPRLVEQLSISPFVSGLATAPPGNTGGTPTRRPRGTSETAKLYEALISEPPGSGRSSSQGIGDFYRDRRRASSGTPSSTFGGRSSTGSIHASGALSLPGHMVSYPESGQWIL